MKAKDIIPGQIYALQHYRGSDLGSAIKPFRVDRVEKTPKRKASLGYKSYGGDWRVYGCILDPSSLTSSKVFTNENDHTISKFIGLWDAAAYTAQEDARKRKEAADAEIQAVAKAVVAALENRGITAFVTSHNGVLVDPGNLNLSALLAIIG